MTSRSFTSMFDIWCMYLANAAKYRYESRPVLIGNQFPRDGSLAADHRWQTGIMVYQLKSDTRMPGSRGTMECRVAVAIAYRRFGGILKQQRYNGFTT